MEISGNSAFYAGLSTIQSGQNRVDQASDLASNMVEMAQGKFQLEAGVAVANTSDEMLGTLIDTFA
ncbi:MAG: hypothetical protein ACRES5_20870 [Pseudomonas sp.]